MPAEKEPAMRPLTIVTVVAALAVTLGACSDTKSNTEDVVEDAGDNDATDAHDDTDADDAALPTGPTAPCVDVPCGAACRLCSNGEPGCVEDPSTLFRCSPDGMCVRGAERNCEIGCEPGTAFTHVDGCNQCFCDESGLVAKSPCTLRYCHERHAPCHDEPCGKVCTICGPDDNACVEPAGVHRCDGNGACVVQAEEGQCWDDDCQQCLASGGTWQGECTTDCALSDTYCFADACPGVCDFDDCETTCLDESACLSVGCGWSASSDHPQCQPVNGFCELCLSAGLAFLPEVPDCASSCVDQDTTCVTDTCPPPCRPSDCDATCVNQSECEAAGCGWQIVGAEASCVAP